MSSKDTAELFLDLSYLGMFIIIALYNVKINYLGVFIIIALYNAKNNDIKSNIIKRINEYIKV